MKNLLLFEAFVPDGDIILTSRQNKDITLTILGGRIDTIDNQSGVNFPYSKNDRYTSSIETWACNNGFKIDGKDPCPKKDERIFGMKVKDIPKNTQQGMELRMLFPNKFRK